MPTRGCNIKQTTKKSNKTQKEALRKKKWREWWQKEGQFTCSPIFKRKPIIKPRKNKELAEFIGIMLGDGGMTSKQAYITLHKKDDKEYIKFVSQLVEKLFGVAPSITKHSNPSVLRIVVSRVNLIDFLVGLGLKRGNKIKQQIDLPYWIKQNNNFAIVDSLILMVVCLHIAIM